MKTIYSLLDREWDKFKNIKNLGISSQFQPTEDQKKAIFQIEKFLDSYSEKVFLLKGYAGTGKTSIVNHVLHKHYLQGKKIAVSAFTNKATNVISKKTPFAQGVSLYKLLGLRSEEDSETLHFNFAGNSRVDQFDIIVLDEVSMVGDNDFDLLIDELKYNYKTKLLIMGDPAQLPPVDQETDSKAFQIKNCYELREIIRQSKDSDIPKYSYYIRQILNSNIIIPISTELPNHNLLRQDITIIDDSKLFIKLMLEAFDSPEYKINSDFVKVIAYRNNTIDKINVIIRKMLFGEKNNPIMIGENIILNAPVMDEGTGFVMYDTSDELEVRDILSHHTYKEKRQGVDIEFDYYLVETRRKYDNKIHIMKIVNPLQRMIFNDMVKKWGKAISKKSMSKIIFRNEFYPFKKEYHNVSYNYAITSHRSQGSTFNKVFVVEDDIEQVSQASAKNLWQSKYVSYTRPSEQLIILNRIKDRKNLKDFIDYESL